MLHADFYAGTRKLPQDFWPPLLKQPIKFVLNCFYFLGGENGFNIPEVVECPEVKEWLEGRPLLKLAESDSKNTSEPILRLFEDASLCFYRNKEMSMYK